MSEEPLPSFLGRLDDFLAWAAEHHKWNPMWCAKHWAPCPVEGKNGIVMSVTLMQWQLAEMPDDVKSGGPTAMNSYQENQVRPICCRIGDSEMARLWAEV